MDVDLKKISRERADDFVDLYNLTKKDELEYIFRGDFTPEIVKIILDLARTTLENLSDVIKIKEKVYYIVGESLQNIARHNTETYEDSPDNFSLFAIQRKKSKFYITTGNVVKNDAIESLKNRIEKINSLEKNDIRSYSRTTRAATDFSQKGGAGIGLIEIAKRSGNKLEYDFKKIDNQYAYFYLNTEIPIINTGDIKTTDKYSIVNVKELHDILVNENVILFFKGTFNQGSLFNLLSIVENQFKESTISIKIYNLMVEMLQNISRHGDDYSHQKDWKTGIFLITETDEEYVLISGNYVLNTKVKAFEKSIQYVNDLSLKDLVIEYDRILHSFYIDHKRQGLGLLDMKQKSKSNLIYNFYPIDENLSFFTIRIVVKK